MMIDILEEHLEELSWLYDTRAHLLHSYEVDLSRLAEWDERWLAHLDGLLIGGEASRSIVERGLAEGDAGSACAAGAVLACWGGERDRSPLEATLQDPGFASRGPFVLGLCLAPVETHEKWLAGWIRSDTPGLRAAAAEVSRFRGIAPPVDVLRALLRVGDQPEEAVVAALGLVGGSKISGCNACVEALFESASPVVRKTALEAAVLLGFRGASDRWRASLKQAGAASPLDLETLGAFGAPEDARFLIGLLDQIDLAPAALRALGWLGSVAAAEPVIARMADRKLGRPAGHAFSLIFGVDLAAEKLVPPAAGGDDEDLELDPYAGLPVPDKAAVASWWRSNGARFGRTGRLRSGRPFSTSESTALLRSGPLADRQTAALEIAFHAKETPRLETRDLATRQQTWIARHLESPSPVAAGGARKTT
ncbi:MAG: hypothetical protein DMF52_04415 [Acidobacteria bacterium]|nr:MAG: hypothetical protein DMF52_04415 [Acidobacteriota bacterium]